MKTSSRYLRHVRESCVDTSQNKAFGFCSVKSVPSWLSLACFIRLGLWRTWIWIQVTGGEIQQLYPLCCSHVHNCVLHDQGKCINSWKGLLFTDTVCMHPIPAVCQLSTVILRCAAGVWVSTIRLVQNLSSSYNSYEGRRGIMVDFSKNFIHPLILKKKKNKYFLFLADEVLMCDIILLHIVPTDFQSYFHILANMTVKRVFN